MHIVRVHAWVILGVALAIAGVSRAAEVSDLVGDKDGFGGQSADPVPADGTTIYTGSNFDNRTLDDPAFTDSWQQDVDFPDSTVSYTHDYALPGEIISAELTIQEAGMSDNRGPWDVVFNGTSIGEIADGDGSASRLVTFNVDISLLTGSDLVELVLSPDSIADGFAINFSELVITYDSTPIPEPTSAMVGLTGVLGLAMRRRRTA